MPKNPRSGRSNYYRNNGFAGKDRDLQEIHNPRNDWYYVHNTGGNYNYKNRKQGPYHVNGRNYSQNYRDSQTSWKGEQGNKPKYHGHSQQSDVHNTNKSSQNASQKLLEALNRTAESLCTSNDNPKKCTQPATKIQEKAVKDGKSRTNILENNVEEQATTESPPRPNFRSIFEEQEQAYKTLKNLETLQQQREEYLSHATTKKVTDDATTVKGVKLFQTREELIGKTKQTRLYNAYKEHVKKDTSGKDYPKTPEAAIATSRWKENYFKPWKFDLVRFGYRFIDGLCWEDSDHDTDE